MDNYYIDDLLNAVENDVTTPDNFSEDHPETITLNIKNFATEIEDTLYDIYPEHHLKELLNAAREWISIVPKKAPVFTNQRTGKSTSDADMTVEVFDLMNGDTLIVNPNGIVAAKN